MLANEAGLVTDTWNLDAFGNILNRTGMTDNPYLLHGQHYDANSGFYYMRARWLDPANGQWLSMDPYVGSMFEPLSLHKYVFAWNNPISYMDPSGLRTLVETMVTTALTNSLLMMLLETAKLAWENKDRAKASGWEWAGRIAIAGVIGAITGALSAGVAIGSGVSGVSAVVAAEGYAVAGSATMSITNYYISQVVVGAAIGIFEGYGCLLKSAGTIGDDLTLMNLAATTSGCILEGILSAALFIGLGYFGLWTSKATASITKEAIIKIPVYHAKNSWSAFDDIMNNIWGDAFKYWVITKTQPFIKSIINTTNMTIEEGEEIINRKAQ